MSDVKILPNHVGSEIQNDHSTKSPSQWKRIVFIATVVAFLTGYGAAHIINNFTIRSQENVLKTMGKIAMSESQLVSTAARYKREIFWAGPMPGYSYALTIDSSGSSVVRYLPNVELMNSPMNSTRMVATYVAKDAYAASLITAENEGVISFKNADSSLVFYNSNNPVDIYMVFPSKDVQVEIFDPSAGQALSLSVLAGQVRPIVEKK